MNFESYRMCLPGTLSRSLVKGKIVLCWGLNVKSALGVKRAEGAGIILVNPLRGNDTLLTPQVLSGTAVPLMDGFAIVNYTWNSTNPTATLVPGTTVVSSKTAPLMFPITSLGPNGLEPNILKVICYAN